MAKSSVSDAEKLYADAVGAKQAMFTTCGSSISIHSAMLTITAPGSRVLVDRNVHKSVVASLILAGAEPVWLRFCWDQGARSPTRRSRTWSPTRWGGTRTSPRSS
jgi:arginine decarboxylase